MNLSEIKDFFDYKPIFDKNPQFLVDQIKFLASQYSKDPATGEKIQEAYEFAHISHGEGERLSGEPYIVHPLKATLFLMDIKPDIETIQTCILHDVIEDTPVSYDDIKKKFGKEVADLCEWLVKVSKVRYAWEDRQLETLKKTFLAMGKDLRVIFVKIADRIHNIQTLHYHPKEEKRHRIAQETMKIFVPIAKRLGLYRYQLYLENGSFRNLEPKSFEKVISFMQHQFGGSIDYAHDWIEIIKHLLHKNWVKNSEVSWRLKSPYRIFEKLDNKYHTEDFGKIMDILAFRIVTDSVIDCYNILWIIHGEFTPLIKKIKDYIAIPKFNGYRSLHTTIFGMFNFPVEIQIRTKEMDEISEFWVAAHIGYSENKGSTTMSEKQTNWIKKLQEIVKTYKSADTKEEFKNELNIELLEKNIFIYTPKWDIVELPNHSTLLDFAFRIHSDVGLKFKHGIVNWVIKPIWHRLQTGDMISIVTSKNKYTASKHWIDFLHTPTAKAKLTKYLNQKDKENELRKSLDLLNKKLIENNLPKIFAKDDLIWADLWGEKLNLMLLRLFDSPEEKYIKLIQKYYKNISLATAPKLSKTNKTNTPSEIKSVVIIDEKLMTYHLCQECKPTISNKIIAKSDKEWMKIHTVSCKAMNTLSYEKVYEAHRKWEESNSYEFELRLEIEADYPETFKILWLYSDLHITINALNIKNNNNLVTLHIQSYFKNPNKIGHLLKEIKKLDNNIKIHKKTTS